MVAKTPGKKLHRAPRRTPEVIAKQADAVKLKVAGATYEDIAHALGYADASGARWAVRAGLAARLDASGVEDLRRLEAERLERMHLSRWKKAVDGDDDAYGLVLQTARQRAALLGLNAPVKIETKTEVRATVVVIEKQRAMLRNEKAIELACDLDAEISRSRVRGDDPGGVRGLGE
jgi:hypothetical protein